MSKHQDEITDAELQAQYESEVEHAEWLKAMETDVDVEAVMNEMYPDPTEEVYGKHEDILKEAGYIE